MIEMMLGVFGTFVGVSFVAIGAGWVLGKVKEHKFKKALEEG